MNPDHIEWPGEFGSNLGIPTKYQAQGYTLRPISFGIPFLNLEASAFHGAAVVHCDLTLVVRLSADKTLSSDNSPIKLTKATTKDARSVTVDCKVPAGPALNSLNLKVYRSREKSVKPGSNEGLLGQANVGRDDKGSALAPGPHQITLLKGTDLPPDPAKPYVVVVATANGKTTQTYFRKWRLATVAHGYAGRFENDRKRTWAWAKKMEADLMSIDRFDKAVALNWIENSVKEQAGMPTLAGESLAKQISDYRAAKTKAHPGDVVDVHLIGHSRGTIVTSKTLIGLSRLGQVGSYVTVTLLDIHPANPSSDTLRDRDKVDGFVIDQFVQDFDRIAQDPQVVLPANAGIKSVDIWWQQTLCTAFDKSLKKNNQHLVNLWGQSPASGFLKNHSGVSIQWNNLSSYGKGIQPNPIGHEEVHEYYQDRFVAKGLVK